MYPLVSPALYVWSLLFYLCLFWTLCPALSSRIKHNAFSRVQLLPSPSLASSHTWCPVPPWFRVVRGQPLLPHSMGREQGWGYLRASPGFGYSGSSLPSCPSLSLDNLLYRDDFPQSTHGVGMTFVQKG